MAYITGDAIKRMISSAMSTWKYNDPKIIIFSFSLFIIYTGRQECLVAYKMFFKCCSLALQNATFYVSNI